MTTRTNRRYSGMLIVAVSICLGGLPPVATAKETEVGATAPIPQPSAPQLTSLVEDGRDLLDARKHATAIERFDEAITAFEYQHRDSTRQIFCARSPAEALFYVAATIDRDEDKDALVLSEDWAEAHFLRGYALLELGKLAEARAAVERALELSPMNANYQAELGFLSGADKNWTESLEIYEEAQEAAALSPDDARDIDTCRALRGQGYALIEMGRLAEAEAKYHECLKLDPNDAGSKHELQYIEQQRQQDEPD